FQVSYLFLILVFSAVFCCFCRAARQAGGGAYVYLLIKKRLPVLRKVFFQTRGISQCIWHESTSDFALRTLILNF
ncbi:MAG: hypothetical protein WAU86_11110, partial [Oricola sp.]